jgi:alpha-tubulin suppressor-like RCC1 family protein
MSAPYRLAAILLAILVGCGSVKAQRTIVAGEEFNVAICDDGSLATWGKNSWGQVGIGKGSRDEGPAHEPVLRDVVGVWCGKECVVARRSDGSTWAWGAAYYFPRVDSNQPRKVHHSPMPYPILSNVKTVVFGDDRVTVLHDDGTITISGSQWMNREGFLGTGDSLDGEWYWGTVKVDSAVWLGGLYNMNFCMLANGTVYGWGFNGQSALGRPTSFRGVAIPSALPDVPRMRMMAARGGRIDGTENVILALDSNGHVWTWGSNYFGQLGSGTEERTRWQPQVIPTLDSVIEVAAGNAMAVALRQDGTVWIWGRTALGRDGYSQWDSSRVPIRIPGLTDIDHIVCGGYHVLARRRDGTWMGWGDNYFGQLNDGTRIETRPATTMRPVCGGLALGVDLDSTTTSSIYPNPTHGIVHIVRAENVPVDVNVYSIMGLLVQSIQSVTDDQVDLNTLVPGSYVVEIRGSTTTIQRTILQVIR